MPAALQDVPWTEIAIQAAAGAKLEDLAEHYGVNLNSLKARCAREKWKQTAREVKAELTGTEVTHPSQSQVQPSATQKGLSLVSKLGDKSKLLGAKVGHSMLKNISKVKGISQVAYAQPFAQTVGALSKIHQWDQHTHNTQVNVQVVNQSNIPDAT